MELLKKVRKSSKISQNESHLGVGINKQREFLIEIYNAYIYREMEKYEGYKQEYIQMKEVDRKRILSLLNQHAKGYKHTQPAEIIMDLVKEERLADTKLYKRLNIGNFSLRI